MRGPGDGDASLNSARVSPCPLAGDEAAELARGRGDLLAEVARVLEGASEGELDEPLARSAARLCRRAGADPEAIPGWVAEGRRRREAARMPPSSGGVRLGGRYDSDSRWGARSLRAL
jgi:hypothetical protein